MRLRNFTQASSRVDRGRYATDRLRAEAEEKSYFPHAHVPILDVDFSDDETFEPDGINDFIRQLGPAELDQL